MENFNLSGQPGQPGQTGQTGQQLNVDLSTLKNYRCLNCNNQIFQQLFIAKKISALQSPSGKHTVIRVKIFVCTNCGDVPLEFGGNLIEHDIEPIKKMDENE